MSTIYANFISGTITADPGSGGTTISGSAFADLPVVTAPDTMWVVLDPNAVNGDPEIVQVTAHTASATSCTVTRAQQSTTARAHPIGTVFQVPATKSDMDELPFRKMTTRGDILVATAANTASRLAVGTAGQAVVSDGVDVSWGAVTAAGIATDAVGADEILAGAVGSSEIATDAVGADEIVANAVGNAEMADNAVGFPERVDSVCRLTYTGTIAAASPAAISTWTETEDTSTMYGSGATCSPDADGVWAIGVVLEPNASNDDVLSARITLNGVQQNADAFRATPGYLGAGGSIVARLVTTDDIGVAAGTGSVTDAARTQVIKLTLVRLA
jgi:hypothetical protein